MSFDQSTQELDNSICLLQQRCAGSALAATCVCVACNANNHATPQSSSNSSGSSTQPIAPSTIARGKKRPSSSYSNIGGGSGSSSSSSNSSSSSTTNTNINIININSSINIETTTGSNPDSFTCPRWASGAVPSRNDHLMFFKGGDKHSTFTIPLDELKYILLGRSSTVAPSRTTAVCRNSCCSDDHDETDNKDDAVMDRSMSMSLIYKR
ncbi:hypothetical protein SAMD00019534_089950 [Acytostelium subglobosum LB1]|uniref:hypothetical protein n=1 Tax=Acytostelium subglobosum LB1 TaxID=1410327 RepID=UPI000644B916|nr:hypothetical protein SAMD00019534_089950 [Acytostelium subglobosum LB1]GAM25820.1 hypothetical protein SAMD00019534_089950 [Acytostelium subglobosum LB1]|eukprot:XP_012751338.1 hypothetical protein SAMD00019534_089950 [Acytostelium subglobosum LB1]